jgi:hypothetical protein
MDLLTGEARAYDPDNVDPDTCQPIGSFTANNGEGIEEVQFQIVYTEGSWTVVHELSQSSVRYCAFTGTDTCETWPLSVLFWPAATDTAPLTPGSTPISSGPHKLYARAKDDDDPDGAGPLEGQWSDWVYVHFNLDMTPTPTPTATATDTPTATATATATASPVPCSVSEFGHLSNDIWWTVTNGSVPNTVIGIDLEFNLSGSLIKVQLGGSDIWSGSSPSPANFTSLSQTFNPLESKVLRFEFSNSVGGSTFTVTVHFSGGCDAVDTKTA